HAVRRSLRSGARTAPIGTESGKEASGRRPLVLAVETRVLVQERQRLERFHPIEKQHAVQVIGLVQDDARWKAMRAQLNPSALPIERADLDLTRARHAPADVGDAQAAFPVVDDGRIE